MILIFVLIIYILDINRMREKPFHLLKHLQLKEFELERSKVYGFSQSKQLRQSHILMSCKRAGV